MPSGRRARARGGPRAPPPPRPPRTRGARPPRRRHSSATPSPPSGSPAPPSTRRCRRRRGGAGRTADCSYAAAASRSPPGVPSSKCGAACANATRKCAASSAALGGGGGGGEAAAVRSATRRARGGLVARPRGALALDAAEVDRFAHRAALEAVGGVAREAGARRRGGRRGRGRRAAAGVGASVRRRRCGIGRRLEALRSGSAARHVPQLEPAAAGGVASLLRLSVARVWASSCTVPLARRARRRAGRSTHNCAVPACVVRGQCAHVPPLLRAAAARASASARAMASARADMARYTQAPVDVPTAAATWTQPRRRDIEAAFFFKPLRHDRRHSSVRVPPARRRSRLLLQLRAPRLGRRGPRGRPSRSSVHEYTRRCSRTSAPCRSAAATPRSTRRGSTGGATARRGRRRTRWRRRTTRTRRPPGERRRGRGAGGGGGEHRPRGGDARLLRVARGEAAFGRLNRERASSPLR